MNSRQYNVIQQNNNKSIKNRGNTGKAINYKVVVLQNFCLALSLQL